MNSDDFDFDAAVQQEQLGELSPDQIMVNLLMSVDDLKLETLIVLTVMQLPEEVRDYLYTDCLIISVGNGIYGQVWPPTKRWLILLDASIVKIKKLDVDDRKSVIAHEIAHAWLNHNQLDPKTTATVEIDAHNLTAQWGFKGIGAHQAHT